MKEARDNHLGTKRGVDMLPISVLMCVYNTKREWLSEAIESILKQTFREFEFIIVLDCPTDGSEGLVYSYAKEDERIVVLKNKTNLGLTKSLNIGLSIAKGKYIARMDSDDVSLPTRLEKQFNYMEANKDTAVVGSRVYTPGMNNAVQYECSDDQEVLRIRLLFNNVGVPHPTAFIRKSVLDENKIKYTESVLKSQDYKLWVDIIPYGPIIMMPDILLMYRVHDNQITADKQSQDSYAQAVALEQAIKLIGPMTEEEKLIHCWFSNPNHIEGGKGAYKRYMYKLITANRHRRLYNQEKFRRELDFMWCQKAWRRFVLVHKIDFFLDLNTLVMIKPSMINYIKKNKQSKKSYLAVIKKTNSYLQ